MSAISRISTNTPWEPIVGYSRLVRAGDLVAVSGTTATDERGVIVGAGQMYVQARQALENIRTALERAGLAMHQVIRTRMFVTDMTRFADVARAHKEFFADSPPASTVVEVRRLANPDMMIEIEADAYAGTANSQAPIAKPRPSVTPKPKQAAKPAPKSTKKPASKKPARRK
jgi:enamine deaminase RidA (YjgF/YER057c/UK114 family)